MGHLCCGEFQSTTLHQYIAMSQPNSNPAQAATHLQSKESLTKILAGLASLKSADWLWLLSALVNLGPSGLKKLLELTTQQFFLSVGGHTFKRLCDMLESAQLQVDGKWENVKVEWDPVLTGNMIVEINSIEPKKVRFVYGPLLALFGTTELVSLDKVLDPKFLLAHGYELCEETDAYSVCDQGVLEVGSAFYVGAPPCTRVASRVGTPHIMRLDVSDSKIVIMPCELRSNSEYGPLDVFLFRKITKTE